MAHLASASLRVGTAALVLLVTCAAARAGGDLTVNTFEDLPDADLNDGVADADLATGGLQTTLRAAVMQANFTAGPDTIVLPEGVLKLTLKGSNEEAAATGDLDVTSEITIQGQGAALSIVDGKKAKDRIFDIKSGGALAMSGVTLRNGKSTLESEQGGGGVRVDDEATLDLTECVVTKCRAVDDGGGVSFQGGSGSVTDTLFLGNRATDDGGGLDLDDGTLTLLRVTFSKNAAGDEGGGMENSAGTCTITNCTFSGNKAKTEAGGLSCEDGGTTSLLSCTLAKNKAKKGSGISEALDDGVGGADEPDTIEIANTIVANKKTTNYSGDGVTSLGHNLENGSTLGLSGTGDLSDADARVAKLADNGGLTPTMALLPDSPALDAADDVLAPATDQRGEPRADLDAVGTAVADIGAFELQAP
jgi:hypothetical protein